MFGAWFIWELVVFLRLELMIDLKLSYGRPVIRGFLQGFPIFGTQKLDFAQLLSSKSLRLRPLTAGGFRSMMAASSELAKRGTLLSTQSCLAELSGAGSKSNGLSKEV